MAVTDAFTRANSGTLGANWTDATGHTGLGIVSNAATYVSGDANGLASYSAVSWNAAHSSQAVFVSGGSAFNGGVTVRQQANGDAYILYLREGNFVRLYLYSGGSFNLLQDYGAIVPIPGSTYKIDVTGTTIKSYKDGGQLGTDQTDATLSNGAPGLYGASSGALVLDDWQGTGEAAGGSPARIIFRQA